ncbi:DUF302 domain-containing protein [uncultured Tateyamaria sp.]|uniref:DUF302 domain-containing protein n=1 Tax=uncultured Tateyamaria sp. TaxID=455651 RepID=UPI002618842E|nr:DUF302 domain-containing protein [uncultured Tateyamaria sp.]
MMRILMALVMGAFLTGAAMAGENGIVRKEAAAGVTETVDQLIATMEGAGLKIFARVDHGAGAQSIGVDIGASQLVIFGNPKVGTPAIQDDPVSGLFLPMKVLVYEDGTGKTMIAYEEPAKMLGRLGGVSEDAAYIQTMTGALGKFTGSVAK